MTSRFNLKSRCHSYSCHELVETDSTGSFIDHSYPEIEKRSHGRDGEVGTYGHLFGPFGPADPKDCFFKERT